MILLCGRSRCPRGFPVTKSRGLVRRDGLFEVRRPADVDWITLCIDYFGSPHSPGGLAHAELIRGLPNPPFTATTPLSPCYAYQSATQLLCR